MEQAQIRAAVLASFKGEVEAYKPGNVSLHASGHDMTADDFLTSAELVTPLLCTAGHGLGKRVFESVKSTRAAVGCNTNLGMLLLFAPLAMAAEQFNGELTDLRQRLSQQLAALTAEDAELVFAAIALASPGGLGQEEKHDVRQAPTCSLREAMQLASSWDNVALQYVNDFEQVFSTGVATIKSFVKRWNSVEWATVACYLAFLSALTDSHLQRKFGNEIAGQVRDKGEEINNKFIGSSEPSATTEMLRAFDEELKKQNYNPGTSADLTAASLLVYNLTHPKE